MTPLAPPFAGLGTRLGRAIRVLSFNVLPLGAVLNGRLEMTAMGSPHPTLPRPADGPRSAAGPRFWLDDSLWPLLVVTLPPTPSDEALAAYLKQLGAYRQRRQPYALLIDATYAMNFSPRQRKMQSEHIRQGLPITRIYLKGIAYVAQSAFKRGIITALHWLVTPPAPHAVFASRVEAEAWLWERLRA